MGEPVADATMQPSVEGSADADASSGAAGDRSADLSDAKGSLLSRLPGILVRVVSWTVLVVCGLLIVGFVLVPRLTGSTPYTVLTGSMRPSMPPGTTVVVKPIDFAEITVGDVITYQISSGEPEVVTHRVIGVNVTPEGVRLETQGDANPVADQELVREEQVRGKAWYWLPVIGYVTNGVSSDSRTVLAQGLGVALIGYAVVTLVVTVVRRKKKDGDDDDGAGGTEAVFVARVHSSATNASLAEGDRAMEHSAADDAATMNDSLAMDGSAAMHDSLAIDGAAVEELTPVAIDEPSEPSEFAVTSETSETPASEQPSGSVSELPTRRSLRRDRSDRSDRSGGIDGQSS